MYTCLYSIDLHQNHDCNEWLYLVEINKDRSETLACNKKNVLKEEWVLSAKVAKFFLRCYEKIFSQVTFIFSTTPWKVIFFFADVKTEKTLQISLWKLPTLKNQEILIPGFENLLLFPALKPITPFQKTCIRS